MRQYDYLVLGGGIAALTAAQTLREKAPEKTIAIVSDEGVPCYSRPMLSKTSLKGFDLEKIYVKKEAWYSDKKIDLIYDTVLAIDPVKKEVACQESTLGYQKLIYALGAYAFQPDVGQPTLVLRTYRDLDAIKRHLPTANDIAIVGGGVIGIETAIELRNMGKTVTIYEIGDWLMPRLLDEGSARLLQKKLEALGITIYLKTIDRMFDLVILSTGIRPNLAVAEAAGIDCDRRGVLVDDAMRTSLPDIFACGDCALCGGINYGLWAQSMGQAKVAAATAVGEEAHYTGVDNSVVLNTPYFGLFMKGDLHSGEEKLVDCSEQPTYRVNPSAGETYEKHFYTDGKLTGAVLIGHLGRMKVLKAEMEEKRDV